MGVLIYSWSAKRFDCFARLSIIVSFLVLYVTVETIPTAYAEVTQGGSE